LRNEANRDEGCLVVEQSESVLRVVLDRPNYANALNPALVEQLLDALNLGERTAIRALTIAGHRKHFCAGFDLSEIDALSDAELVLRFVRIETLLQRIYHAPFLTVAAVHGHAIGAGVDLLCACEIRIATEGSLFRMPGWHFGIALGTRRLASRIDRSVARSILSSGKSFDARTALQIGLLTQMAPQSEWPAIIAKEVDGRLAISRHAYADLVRTTVLDTREIDMASLVMTASRPGLRERIKAYTRADRNDR
jgi:enoyl-CoA hydratase/carnithine racemase